MGFVTKLFLLASAVFMALFVSCDGRRSYPRSLLVADSLADCDPDSAIALLGILGDSARFMPRQDSMYYALLKVKATDKAYLPHDTTGGILDIVAYYEHGGDRRLLPTAYYYAGRAYRNMNKPATSVKYFYEAINVAEGYDDTKTLALCHAQIANMLYANRLYEEAIEAYTHALHYDSIRRNYVGMMFGFRDLACCYNKIGKSDSALLLFDKGLALSDKTSNMDMKSLISSQKALLCLRMKKYGAAERLINVSIAYNDSADRSSVLSIASRLYRETGREDKALMLDKLLTRIGNVYGREAAHERLAKHYSSLGMTDSAIYHLNLHKEIVDSLNYEIAADNTAAIKTQLKQLNDEKEQGENEWLKPYVLIVVCIVIFAFVIVLLKKERNKSKRSDEPQDEEEPLVCPANMAGTDTGGSGQQLELSPVVMKIKRFCNDKTSGSATATLRITDCDWEELDAVVNKAYTGFKQKLLAKVKMSEQEYRVCLLIKIGIQPADIARLTYKDTSTISNIRRRLYKKYFGEDGNGELWDRFIHTL